MNYFRARYFGQRYMRAGLLAGLAGLIEAAGDYIVMFVRRRMRRG